MERTKQELIQLIKQTVYEVTNVKVEDENMNLLDNRLAIQPAGCSYTMQKLR